MRRLTRKLLWAGLGLVALSAAQARADFVPVFTGDGGTPGNFNYNLAFSTNTATPPVEQLNPFPTPDANGHESGGFVTIYDFNFGTNTPATSVTVPATFTFTIQNTGLNAFNTAPPDNPTVTNVTFYYHGAVVTTDTVFTGFQLRSSLLTNLLGSYSGNDAKVDTTGPAPIYLANGATGSVTVAASVPEPASMALLGIGGLGAVSLFRRKKAIA